MSNDSKDLIAGKLSPPFFVMGCQRSGTTLVARILDSHSRIAVYLGTHYYLLFGPDRHRYGDLRKSSNLMRLIDDLREDTRVRGVNPPEAHEFLEALVAPTFEGVLTTFLHLYAQRQGKVRSSDKTPEHYFYLSEILEKFPESPVIFTMRDPRDAVLSIRKGMGTSLDGSIWAWSQAFLSYQRASRPVHLVRYEDLVRKPAETVEAMCAFLGERYEPTMFQYFEHTPVRFHTMSHHWKLFKPVDAGSIGNFRQMPTHEIERIEAACAAGMEAMGYPCTIFRPKVVKIRAPKKRSLLNFLLDRLHYYRWDRARWRRGWCHWKRVLRVRARYWLMLGPLRKNW